MAGVPRGLPEELALCWRCGRLFHVGERAPPQPAGRRHACPACTRAPLGRPAPLGGRPEPPSARLLADLHRLAVRQREFLLRALDAATTLKVRIEAELAAPAGLLTAADPALLEADFACGAFSSPTAERERLQRRHAEALYQCKLDDLIYNASVPLNFELIRRTLPNLTAFAEYPPAFAGDFRDPILFLANYCMAQLFTRHCLALGALTDGSTDSVAATLEIDAGQDSPLEGINTSPDASSGFSIAPIGTPMLNPATYPLYYFNLEVNSVPFGRVVIEVRDDIAPRMSRNFLALVTGELGVGYRGCSVFQCWDVESIITGDFEFNNGRGGRSVYKEKFFVPDETNLSAVRGAVGMRRTQRRHDTNGMVGSQFRITLQEMRGFTAIFAFVAEGLELLDQVSRMGDSSGKPHSAIIIASCGKLN